MTKIAIITGTNRAKPTAKDLVNEANDRAKLVTPLPFFDTTALSEGEMLVYLQAAKDRIFMQYFPDQPQYKAAFERKVDALYKGLHRGTGLLSFGERAKTKPAGGWLSWEQKGFDPKKGLSNLFDDAPEAVAVRGIGNVPQLDCNALYPIMSEAEWIASGAPPSVWPGWVSNQNAKRAACTEENVWRKLLNDNLAKFAHHPLYEFATGGEAIQFPLVLPKRQDHQNAVSALQSQSKISRAILRQWLDTGIVYENTRVHNGGGTPGPYTPQETIDGLRYSQATGIGIVWTAPLIIALVSAIAAALTAAGQFVLALKNKRPTAAQQFELQTQGWGGATWGAEKSDWYIDPATGQPVPGNNGGGYNGSSTESLITDNLPIILLGVGGAALYLSEK